MEIADVFKFERDATQEEGEGAGEGAGEGEGGGEGDDDF